jgi:hypothetical protein
MYPAHGTQIDSAAFAKGNCLRAFQREPHTQTRLQGPPRQGPPRLPSAPRPRPPSHTARLPRPHLDQVPTQRAAVAHEVAERARRVGARLLLVVVREQRHQRRDGGAERVVQQRIVEAWRGRGRGRGRGRVGASDGWGRAAAGMRERFRREPRGRPCKRGGCRSPGHEAPASALAPLSLRAEARPCPDPGAPLAPPALPIAKHANLRAPLSASAQRSMSGGSSW